MRIEPRPVGDCPWYLRLFFWNQRRKYGEELQPALLWARVPRLFLSMGLFYAALNRKASPLDPALRALVSVRVSQLNGCAFCVDLNAATLLRVGVSPEKALAVAGWRESGLFGEPERAALDYAEAVTLTDRGVDDAAMAALKAHFDDDAVIELTALIGFQNLSSKFNTALGAPPQGLCALPEAPAADAKQAPKKSGE